MSDNQCSSFIIDVCVHVHHHLSYHIACWRRSKPAILIITRAGTNTPSDEYDSYRIRFVSRIQGGEYEYIFANTVIRCIHSRILLTECASEEEEVKNVYSANTYGLHYT